ncbi:uncharacterized protein [Dermacentor albipictus]|uniref:uncharacterized protein n=1 Tax=Dermacentor albipictus TaxID=60249 RepID=UPI0038FCB535
MKKSTLILATVLLFKLFLVKAQGLSGPFGYRGASEFPERPPPGDFPGYEFAGPGSSSYAGSRRCGRNFCPPGQRCVQVSVQCIRDPCAPAMFECVRVPAGSSVEYF